MTKTATPQPIRAPPQRIWASFTPSSILNLMGDAPIQINEDDVAVNKDSSSFSQYTVSHTVYLNEKVVNENSKVYQLNKEIKSFVWRTWDLQQALAVKKYSDAKGYFYYKHNVKTTINCLNARKNSEISVTLRDTSNWVKVKNLIKLWDSLKKKEITVIIKVNWG